MHDGPNPSVTHQPNTMTYNHPQPISDCFSLGHDSRSRNRFMPYCFAYSFASRTNLLLINKLIRARTRPHPSLTARYAFGADASAAAAARR